MAKHRKPEEQGNKEDSVWTSYSDLFATVAIVFLIMFVFALIKAGVSSLQTMKERKNHEDELKGKVSEKIQKKNQENIQKINNSLDQMNEYQDLISKKVLEMNSFAQKMQENKQVMADLLEDQKRKDSILEAARQELLKNEEELKIELENKQKLQERIAKKEEELKQIVHTKDKVIESIKAAKIEAEKLNQQRKVELENLEIELKNKKIEYETQLVAKTEEIQDIQQSFEVEKASIKNDFFEKEKEIKNLVNVKEQEKIKVQEDYEQKINQLLAEKQKDYQKLKNEIQEIDQEKLKLNEIIKNKDLQISQNMAKQEDLKTILKNKEELIELNKQQLKDKEDLIKDFDQKIAKIKSEKIQKDHELAQTVEIVKKQKLKEFELTNYISELDKKLKSQQIEAMNLNKLSEDLKNKNLAQLDKINHLNTKNNELSQSLQNSQLKEMDLQKDKTHLYNAKNELEKKLSQLSQSLEDSKNKVALVSDENNKIKKMFNDKYSGHQKEVNDLNNKINDLRQKIGQAEKELDGQKSFNNKIAAENNDLKQKLMNLHGKRGQDYDQLEKQHALLSSKFKQCDENQKFAIKANKDLKNTVKDIGRRIASLKSDLRSSIASKLADKFKNNNVLAKVDPITGNVTLDLGKTLLFAKNSYKISKGAKDQLMKIIPIYAEVLFSDKKASDQIASFNIEGHASPYFKGKFQSPLKIDSQAYAYNMLLSGQRAAAISSFMFGKTIGDYSHKIELKDKTRSVGYGYTVPVKFNGDKKRSIASKNACFPFDCALSQRVELSFTLKDDNESLEKLFDLPSEAP